MKVFITGGAGFIGSNVAKYYLDKGALVSIFDNFSRSGSKKNVLWLKNLYPNLIVYNGQLKDIQNEKKLPHILGSADLVVHLAAQVAVTTSVEDPIDDFEINAGGTLRLLEILRQIQSKAKIIYSSTNKVYGGMEEVRIKELKTRYAYADFPYGISEVQPLDFHSPYGCSKGAADQYVHDYARIYGLDTVVFRQSCIYGPRQFGKEDQGWVAWFIIATLMGKPLTVYGDGKQIRDLLYIDDLVKAYDMAYQQGAKSKGQIYNIGGGTENTMSVWYDFGPILNSLFGRNISVTFKNWRPGDQKVYVSDIRKARKELGWQPEVSVKEGIKKLYSWVRENKSLFI
jgi:CDP-paratose 2-epimerase